MFKMKIRLATFKDEKFVKNLDKENMEPVIESLGGKYQGYMLDSFNPQKCFIIENGKPIGFAYFRIPGNKLEIQSIQIKEQFHGKGYGQKLMNHIINFAREKRLKKITLEAHKFNKKAIRFYENFEFKNMGETKKGKIGFEFNLK